MWGEPIVKFSRINRNDPDPIHYSPTELVTCPKILLNKKEGKIREYSEDTLKVFEEGSTIHFKKGILRDGMKGLLNNELHMSAIHDSKEYVISGYADFLMFDLIGLYIEDLKSCKKGAFYHFLKEKGSSSEILQVSIYGFLYFVVNKVRIEKGVITKIDRDNPRNSLSLEIDLIPIEEIEKFILEHPTINFINKAITKKEFLARTKEYVKVNRWFCKYCDDLSCVIRKELENDDKIGIEKENTRE